MAIRVGSVVRRKGQKLLARVELFYSDIPGGVRLDRLLDGFFSWNVEDLEVAPRSERKRWAPLGY